MIIVLLLVYIVPFALAINTVLDNAERIAGWATGPACAPALAHRCGHPAKLVTGHQHRPST